MEIKVDIQTSVKYDPELYFGTNSRSYVPNLSQNEFFVTMIKRWAENRLMEYGHVVLNELLERLDLPQTAAGCVIGWIKGSTIDLTVAPVGMGPGLTITHNAVDNVLDYLNPKEN